MSEPIDAEFLKKIIQSKASPTSNYKIIGEIKEGNLTHYLEIRNPIWDDLVKKIALGNPQEQDDIARNLIAIENVIKNIAGINASGNGIQIVRVGDELQAKFRHQLSDNLDKPEEIRNKYRTKITELSMLEIDSSEFKKLLSDANMAKTLLSGKPKQVNLENDFYALPPNLMAQRKPISRMV